MLRETILKSSPSLVLVAETHVTEVEAFDQYHVPGYRSVSCLSHSRHTGGVAIYARDSVVFKVLCNRAEGDNWFLGVAVTRGVTAGHYGVVYHSPSSSDSRFVEILEGWLDGFIDFSKRNVVLGDFNIDWLNSDRSESLKRVMTAVGMRQTVGLPTRITRVSRTLIDHVYCNFGPISVRTVSTLKISDHETIGIRISRGRSDAVERHITCLSNYSKQSLCNKVAEGLQRLTGGASNDLNDKANCLWQVLEKSMESFTVQRLTSGRTFNKWYNTQLARLKRKRDQAYERFIRTNISECWYVYTALRNEYTAELKKAKQTFFCAEISKYQGCSRELWKILKSMLKPEDKPVLCVKFAGCAVFEEASIAEGFNNFFVESVKTIHQGIASMPEPIELRSTVVPSQRFKFERISYDKLRKVCFSLNKKAGIGRVNAQVLQDCFHVGGRMLLSVINQSLESGVFPASWKESVVVPIPKVSGTTNAEEFRPINMLNILEKVLEIVVKEQLILYLDRNNLLVREQSGYRSGHSCESALNLVLAKWKELMERKQPIVAVFLDLKRAFETISRPLLLKTIERFGIVGVELKWFADYLQNRTQRTVFMNHSSNSINNNLGVPQGSVLGPLLFIMYINDMKSILKYCDINLFADDTVLFVSRKDIKEAESLINIDLMALDGWLKYKKLALNVKKTKYMVLSERQTNSQLSIAINQEPIDRVRQMKYLGVTLDDELKFGPHMDYIISKVAKKCGVICRLSSNLNFFGKVQLYRSLISPHFDFCASILFLGNQTQMQRLQRLQNRVMRMILGCGRCTSSTVMLDILQWMSVRQRIVYQTVTFIYKIIKGIVPMYLGERIVVGSQVHRYCTRRAAEPRLPRYLSGNARNSLFFKGVHWYNSLPRSITQAETLSEFKRLCSAHIRVVV